jgi:hypothetical protein
VPAFGKSTTKGINKRLFQVKHGACHGIRKAFFWKTHGIIPANGGGFVMAFQNGSKNCESPLGIFRMYKKARVVYISLQDRLKKNRP